jgi:hypothetical protein
MKVRTGILMLALASGAIWAQSAPQAAPAAPPAAAKKQSTAKPASAPSSAKTAASSTTKTTTSSTTKSTTSNAAKTTTKKKASKPAAGSAPAGNVATNVAAEAKPVSHASKRDPFVSPIQSQANGPINCGTGKRCLVVDQTVLEGIVKAPNGMIAVVSNSANKAYFLRENDPVYNGFVMRITPDSVVFREQVSDKFGKTSTREIVKKVTAPVV